MATYEISDGNTTFISWSGHLRPARDQENDNTHPIIPLSIDINNENDIDD
jgi:hypothetical protein